MTNLHPLHEPRFAAQYILDRGEYPGSRMTGRSTSLALQLLSAAIKVPGLGVTQSDHSEGIKGGAGLRFVRDLALDIAARSGLRHIHPSGDGIVFERR